MQRKYTLPLLAMILLFLSSSVVEVARLTCFTNQAGADIWWHLCAGLAMLATHAVPHTGLFTQASGSAWVASSWGYELLLGLAYKLLALRAIPALYVAGRLLLAVLTFLLAGGTRGSFWRAVALSAAAQYILAQILPGPALCSVLFFALELWLIVASKRGQHTRCLYWLPLLFLLWANIHVEFIYGLVVLGWLVLASLLEDLLPPAISGRTKTPNRWQPLAIVLGASCAATLCTPYLYQPYVQFGAFLQSDANLYLRDYQAMSFRQPQDFVLLLMVLAAFLTMGLRRSRDLFIGGLLIAGSIVSFRYMRDMWVVLLVALLVLGESSGGEPEGEERRGLTHAFRVATTAAVVLLCLALVLGVPRRQEALLARASTAYPVAACNYIRQNHLAQPIFNPYEWGGFLSWYLPEYPAAIDGRLNLYGDNAMVQYFKVMRADLPPNAFPPFAQATTILLQRQSLLGRALGDVPGFRVAYSDNVSLVLTRE